MKKGSRSGYDAETGEESAGSESSLGEPYEQPSLYRIRRTQENHQFLCQDRGWGDRGRRPCAGATRGIATIGCGPATALAGSDGSDPIQRLDLRHTEARRRTVGDGASRQNESHQCRQKKSDTLDARTIADLVRCNLLPACYVAPPRIRELRRLLRYRSLVVSEAVRMKNKMAGLLMETGSLYVKQKLHRKKYFTNLLEELEEVPESVIDLLRLSRGALEMFESTQKRLVRELLANTELAERVERLMTIPAVGEITALTWALEVGDPQRFRSSSEAMSYCGLTAALKSSAGKQQRGPISKQRNHWLQTTLIEAAKLAPRWNPQLAALHAPEMERGHCNRATLAVARKLVAYLLAVDKSLQPFQMRVPLEVPIQKAA